MHSLLDISEYDVNYLSSLNYIDIQNLCRTSSAYQSLCQNDVLFLYILSQKGLMVPLNASITKVLKNLYRQFYQLVNINFVTLSRWVIVDVFKDDTVKMLSSVFAEILSDEIGVEETGELIIPDEIHLFEAMLAFPLYSEFIDYDDLPSDTGIESTIILSNDFKEYIRPALSATVKPKDKKHGSLNYKAFYVLLDLLFINHK